VAGRKQFDVERALDAAMETFWEHGYDGTSMSMLTAATGLGKGSLYGTFGTKEQLFRQCLTRYGDLYRAAYESALDDTDPVQAVRGFFETMVDRMIDPRFPGGCLIAQSAALATELDPTGRAAVEEMLRQQRLSVQAMFERAGVPVDSAIPLAEYVVAVRQALAVLNRAGRSEHDLRQVVDITCQTVVSAVASVSPNVAHDDRR
jgi:AcrR family transcriptional regulator